MPNDLFDERQVSCFERYEGVCVLNQLARGIDIKFPRLIARDSIPLVEHFASNFEYEVEVVIDNQPDVADRCLVLLTKKPSSKRKSKGRTNAKTPP